MEAAILHRGVDPFVIAARVKKVAILQAAADKDHLVKDETLIAKGFVFVYTYFASHVFPLTI